jgi:hypothetical protein
MAQTINQAALSEKEKVSGFSEGLLFGESAAVWDEENQSSAAEVRSQSRAVPG